MRFSGKKKEAFLVHAPSYILEKGCAQEKWHRFRFSRPSVSLLSEIKDRGRGGSNRDTVFRHGDHGESSTCSRKGPTRSAFESNLVDFFPIQVQSLLSITFWDYVYKSRNRVELKSRRFRNRDYAWMASCMFGNSRWIICGFQLNHGPLNQLRTLTDIEW